MTSFEKCSCFFLGLLLLNLPPALADPDRFTNNLSEPELYSLVPLGGELGSTLVVEVHGKFLAGTYATWLGHDSFEAQVKSVEPMVTSEGAAESSSKDDGEYRVRLEVTIAPDAIPGPHPLRLVSPGGVSNLLYLQVHDNPVMAESVEPHHRPSMAQPLVFPVVINGVISRQAELDYYSLEVSEGQELAFEVILSHQTLAKGFRPQLRLYEQAGSWLGSRRLTQLAFHSEILGEVNFSPGYAGPPPGSTPINSGLKYRFPKAGRYLLEVAAERFQGNADFAYQLRVVPVGVEEYERRLESSAWGRTFRRRIASDRLDALWSRTVTVNQPASVGAEKEKTTSSQPNPETSYDSDRGKRSEPIPARVTNWTESEPNDGQGKAMEVTLPALIEGTIDRPEDVDFFKFKLKSVERLAFEIETPRLSPPHFTPRLEIRDAAGRTMLTNLHRVQSTREADRWVFKNIEPKVIETFDKEGEYTVVVGDVTSRNGNRQCEYRLLIRPQIPHVGEITVETLKRGSEDARIDPLRINLRPGEAKTLNITTRIEEIDARVTDAMGQRAFDWGTGEISLLVEGLPEGVRALPGTAILEIAGTPRHETIRKANFLPDLLKSVLVFQADPDAAPTTLPEQVRIVAQPLIGGKPGQRLLAVELPLMVIAGSGSKTKPAEVAGR